MPAKRLSMRKIKEVLLLRPTVFPPFHSDLFEVR